MHYFIDITNQPKAIFYSDEFQQAGYKLAINKQASLNLHIVILDAQKAKSHADNTFRDRIKSAEQESSESTYSNNKMLNFRNDVFNKKVDVFTMGFAATSKIATKSTLHEDLQRFFSNKKLEPKFNLVITMGSGLTRTALAIASNVPQLPVLIDESTANDLMANNLCCPKFGYPPAAQLFDKNSPVYRIFCNTQHPEVGKYCVCR
jgi:hypothetical protein